mgnify:CR=1 FL=1|tara:strand:- start:443 stop:1528 length:1086 start_codon:yes stop_codon:yes gene_type:complete
MNNIYTGILYLNNKYKNKNKIYCLCKIPNIKYNLIKFFFEFNIIQKLKINNINKIYIIFKIKKVLVKLNKVNIICTLIKEVGDVENYNNFLVYNIFLKNIYGLEMFDINYSWRYKLMRESFIDEIKLKYNVESRVNFDIISIDPLDCYIIDDAIGYNTINDVDIISIYIPNIFQWIVYFNLYKKYSTIKNNNNNLINSNVKIKNKTIIDNFYKEFFSLKKYNRHLCLTIDIYINNFNIIYIEYKNTIISVRNNFRYDESLLECDKLYNRIFNLTKRLNISNKILSKITRSNDVIEYYMTLINNNISTIINKINRNIYNINKSNLILNIDSNLYTHITSPIKYLNDIVNIERLNKYIKVINN